MVPTRTRLGDFVAGTDSLGSLAGGGINATADSTFQARANPRRGDLLIAAATGSRAPIEWGVNALELNVHPVQRAETDDGHTLPPLHCHSPPPPRQQCCFSLPIVAALSS